MAVTVEEIIGEVSVSTEAKIVSVRHWGETAITALDDDSIRRVISVLSDAGYEIVRKSGED